MLKYNNGSSAFAKRFKITNTELVKFTCDKIEINLNNNSV